MTEEVATPETGAMTEADAIASLMNRSDPEKDNPDPEAKQDAEPAQEPDDDDTDTGTADEAEGSDDTEEEEQPDATPRYKVKAAGEEVEVTLDELLKGYSRETDYRRKTQTLADERREIEAERQRQQDITAQLIEAYQKAATTGDDKEPDWSKLADELDPWEFNKRRAAWDVTKHAKAEAARNAQELRTKQVREIAAAEAERLRTKAPEWRDPARFKADFDAITKTAVEDYGFRAEELGDVLDHRVMLVLRDAAEMRRIRAAKPDAEKRVVRPTKVVKPGSPPNKAEAASHEVETVRKRFTRTGSVDDAVEYLLAKGK